MDFTFGHKWDYHVVVRFPEDEETSSIAGTPLDSSTHVEKMFRGVRNVTEIWEGGFRLFG